MRCMQALEHYCELLTYVKIVPRNYSEKSINNMLDYAEKTISATASSKSTEYLQQFYSHTLQSFQETNNERLWLKTNIKLAKLLLDKHDYAQLLPKIRELHKACEKEDGTEDPNKGTYSLEIYAMEIQMYASTKNNAQLKIIYPRALKIKSAVPHPRVMGVIRECGGKMHMSEENWTEAQSDFFEAFRNYDEAGALQRYQVLKYLVLTTMLMKSDINPFESQETKPYRGHPSISAMTDLVDAYQRDDIRRYEEVLKKSPDLLEDTFIAENIDEVTRNMRTKALLKLIAPYTRFKLSTIASRLAISTEEVQDILGFLTIDGKVKGRINQKEGTMEIMEQRDEERIEAVKAWRKAVEKMINSTWSEGEGFAKMFDKIEADPGVAIGGASAIGGATPWASPGTSGMAQFILEQQAQQAGLGRALRSGGRKRSGIDRGGERRKGGDGRKGSDAEAGSPLDEEAYEKALEGMKEKLVKMQTKGTEVQQTMGRR